MSYRIVIKHTHTKRVPTKDTKARTYAKQKANMAFVRDQIHNKKHQHHIFRQCFLIGPCNPKIFADRTKSRNESKWKLHQSCGLCEGNKGIGSQKEDERKMQSAAHFKLVRLQAARKTSREQTYKKTLIYRIPPKLLLLKNV